MASFKNKIREMVNRILGFKKEEEVISRQDVKQSFANRFLTHLGYGSVAEFLNLEYDLMSRYVDYEEMDISGEICSTVLDIYADDSTMTDYQTGLSVIVNSNDEHIKNLLQDMLDNQIDIDNHIWLMARGLCKYGNFFDELVLKKAGGLHSLNHLPPATMRVITNARGDVIGYWQTYNVYQAKLTEQEFYNALKDENFFQKTGNIVFGLNEIAHFKLGAYKTWSVYGTSILEPARWIWRRLILLEDSVLIYRLTRAPSRYVFYIDTGDIPPADVPGYLNAIKDEYKKHKFVDPSTGRLNFKFNPLGQNEDFFIPTRQGKDSTRIEVLSGPTYSYIEDVEYFRDKLLAAVKVPKAYMSYTEEVNRATLSSLDVKFARSVMGVQRELRNGLKQICDVHLASLGIYPSNVEYDLRLAVPSQILELAQLEIMKARVEVASDLKEFFPLSWILTHVFHLSKEETDEILGVMENSDINAETISSDRVNNSPLVKLPNDEITISNNTPLPDGSIVTSPEGNALVSDVSKTNFRKLLKDDILSRGKSSDDAIKKINHLIRHNRHLEHRLTEIRHLLLDIIHGYK